MPAACLFCKIRDGQVPAKLVYHDDECLAFEDINPQAPMHVLVIPRRHIATINDVTVDDRQLVGHLFLAAKKIALERGYNASGYRTVMNCGSDAGQTVFHLHLHVLGGRPLTWPPG